MNEKKRTIKTLGKTIIYSKLELKTNLHIGSDKASIDTDALCIRNAEGDLIIPGTTLAGIFRSNLETLFGENDTLIRDLFGFIGTDESIASNIIFQDALLENPQNINSDIRDGVKINRKYLSAEEGAKYDKETVLRGSIFQGIITINKTDKNMLQFNKYIELLKVAFYNLNEGLVPIGGGSSRGLGLCSIKECHFCSLDFTNSKHLNDFLLGDFYDFEKIKNEPKYLKPFGFKAYSKDLEPQKADYFIKADYIVTPVEPLLINGPRTNDEEVDFHFVKTNDTYFIPGSSAKGPVRNRAEIILATLGVSNGQTVIERLFGSTEQKSKLQFYDLFPRGELEMKYFDHNKIDRFTGGTMEKALFNEKLVFNGQFQGTITADKLSLTELKLLMQIFKDFYLEDIRIGYGKTKGYGKIKGEIKKLSIYGANGSKIGGVDLTDYGFNFSKKENIYEIYEIENIYSRDNIEKYNKFLKLMDKVQYA